MKIQIGVQVQYNIRSDISLKVALRKKLEIKIPVSFLCGAAHLFFFFSFSRSQFDLMSEKI
jgi:hypothetical protein